MEKFRYEVSEKKYEDDIIKLLRYREWVVIKTNSNRMQQGFPDLFAAHVMYGWRWIEVKKREGYRFTAAQEKYFPIIKKIWIMHNDSWDEYNKLHKQPNWYHYLKPTHKSREFNESIVINRDQNEEEILQQLFIEGWTTIRTHGNVYQKGLPDLYCIHPKHGHRWVEIKNPNGFTFTGAQLKTFKMLDACGVGIWILRKPEETKLLLEKPNLRTFI